MKKKLLVAVAATVVASSAMAQSAFEGFYGQIATGYENNKASSLNSTNNDAGSITTWSANNQTVSGTPLILGAGYNFSVAPKWVVGLGADYSAISQKSSTYNYTSGSATLYGAYTQYSNRYNIFVAPGYELDKDKLVYLKAGYSSVSAKSNSPTSYTWSGTSGAIAGTSQTKTLSGYVLGLGYKQFITSGLYGLAEVNYMTYNKSTYSSLDSNGASNTSNPGLNSYQVLVGLGYKF